MSDIFDTMLQGIPSDTSTKSLAKSKQIASPILYSSVPDIEDIEYTFLVDKYLSKREITVLQKAIEKKIVSGYQILYALRVIPTEKDLKKTVWEFYYTRRWDYSIYIPRWSKVFSFGKSLFSLTGSNDLDCSLVRDEDSNDSSKKKEKLSIIQGFYDTILWKTSFFSSELLCEIYPVDGWESLIKEETGLFKNSFEYWFFNKQMVLAKKKVLSSFKIKKLNTVIVDNPNEFLKQHSDNKELIGYDLETNGLDPWKKGAKIRCITIAFSSDPYTGYFLEFKDINKFVLSSFLKDRPLVGTNIKFDAKFTNVVASIPKRNIIIAGDTMQLQHICNEMMRKGLKAGAWLYTPYGGYDKELDTYLNTHPEIKNDYSKIPQKVLAPYASNDPCVSLLVHQELENYRDTLDALINKDNPYGYNLKWSYDTIIVPTLNMFTDIELTGMSVEMSILKEQSDKLKPVVVELEETIRKELKETKEFNVASGTQLGKKLEELDWPIYDRDKRGIPKTGEPQLIEWEKKGYSLASTILKYREQKKLLSTYVGVEEEKSGIYKWLRDDGKLHSQYHNFLALSWRHTSSSPNGQNFVAHGEKAVLSRSFLCPCSKDHAFLSTDYSGLQLRLAAIVSGDEQMVRAFKYEGGDIHLRTAYNVMLKYMTKIESIEEAQKIRKGSDEQAEYINDMRFKSKCFIKGTKLLTNKGPMKVEDFIPEINPEEFTPYKGDIKMEINGEKEISSTFFGYTNETIEFELENGDTLEVTPDHNMIVLREGIKMTVMAKDVIDTDEFIEYYP